MPFLAGSGALDVYAESLYGITRNPNEPDGSLRARIGQLVAYPRDLGPQDVHAGSASTSAHYTPGVSFYRDIELTIAGETWRGPVGNVQRVPKIRKTSWERILETDDNE